jgi:hypothetical protein
MGCDYQAWTNLIEAMINPVVERINVNDETGDSYKAKYVFKGRTNIKNMLERSTVYYNIELFAHITRDWLI